MVAIKVLRPRLSDVDDGDTAAPAARACGSRPALRRARLRLDGGCLDGGLLGAEGRYGLHASLCPRMAGTFPSFVFERHSVGVGEGLESVKSILVRRGCLSGLRDAAMSVASRVGGCIDGVKNSDSRKYQHFRSVCTTCALSTHLPVDDDFGLILVVGDEGLRGGGGRVLVRPIEVPRRAGGFVADVNDTFLGEVALGLPGGVP